MRPPPLPSTSVPADDESDEALMLASRQDDTRSFAILAGRYASRLVAYCLQYTRNLASAEEVAQDTWLGLWAARRTYEPSARFVVLLFTAAKNRCRNRQRGTMRAATALGSPSADDVDSLTSSLPSGLESALATERRTRLYEHVAELSDTLREALVLRVIDDLSYADIAAILHIPETTARTRVHLAVQRLRELGRKDLS